MSADRWSMCPRCVARDGVGLHGNEFREDFEIGQDDGVVTVSYRGECQRCNLLLEFTEEHPIPDLEPPGPRTAQARQLTWGQVPAGWYVQAPGGKWYEVTSTRQTPGHGAQIVNMAGGTFSRDPVGLVTACPGPPNATDAAIEALGYPQVLEDGS